MCAAQRSPRDGSALPRLHLLGALGLTGPDGTDRTPRGRKAQALLAMLALSPRGTRTRVWLRDKLWSESDEARGSSSLRQTVFELKKDLGPLAGQILAFERTTVTLRLERVWIDVRVLTDNPGGLPPGGGRIDLDCDLLEGMDIPDEEFEEWLMTERSAWDRAREEIGDVPRPRPRDAAAPAAPGVLPDRPVIDLALMPTIAHGDDGRGGHLGDYVTETVAGSLGEYQPVNVIDLRDDLNGDAPQAALYQPDYMIRTRTLAVGGALSVTFLVYDAASTALLLSQSMQAGTADMAEDGMGLVNQFIAQNVDHLAKIMTRGATGRPMLRHDRGCLLGYNILAGMFELAPERMEAALEVLERGGEAGDNALFPSLLAYTSSFALGENIGSPDPARLERTRALAAEVLQANPFNSISLACIGHVYGYVLGEHDLAADLFARAVKLNPMQAFVWDHVALHRLYIGDLAGARAASDRAVALGGYSPINYAYETTSCMVAALAGDHRRAVQLGERALVKQPRFHAAMRYALSSLGHLGERERAERVKARLLQADPDFADPEVQRARFRLPVPGAHGQVLEGIARAGL